MKKSKASHVITTVKAEIHIHTAEGEQHAESERKKRKHRESDTQTESSELEELLQKQPELGNKTEQKKHISILIGAALIQPRGHGGAKLIAKDIYPAKENKDQRIEKIEHQEKAELKAKRGEHKLTIAKENFAETFEELPVTDAPDQVRKVQTRSGLPDHSKTKNLLTLHLTKERNKNIEGELQQNLYLQENDPNTRSHWEHKTPAALVEKRCGSKRTVTIANYVMRQMRTKKEQTNWTTACIQETVKKRFKEQQVNTDPEMMEQGKVIMTNQAVESVYWDRYRKCDLKTSNEVREKEEYVPMSTREKEKEKRIREILKVKMYGQTETEIGEIQGNLCSASDYWRRKQNQNFNAPRNTEAMPTYILGKIIRKTKDIIYNKQPKKVAANDENETTGEQTKEAEEEAALKQQKEELKFYKAARSDKPGDFLLHTGGGSGPVQGPEAETQTERGSPEDSSSEGTQEQQEDMPQLNDQEKWEICEKLREEQISKERAKGTKGLDEKEDDQKLKQQEDEQKLKHQDDKQGQPEQNEKKNIPEQQDKQKTQEEQEENIEKPKDSNGKKDAPKTKEIDSCEEPPPHKTAIKKPLIKPEIKEKELQEKLKKEQELPEKLKKEQKLPEKLKTDGLFEKRDVREVTGLQNPKTPVPNQKETPVYQKQTASIQNVLLQQRILSVPGKAEAHVYLGKPWKMKLPKSVAKEKTPKLPEPETQKLIEPETQKPIEPETQKLIDTLEAKPEPPDTPELQKQLGIPEDESKSTPKDYLTDRKSPTLTTDKLNKKILQETIMKRKVKKEKKKVEKTLQKKKNPSKLFKEKMKTPLPMDALNDADEDIYTGLFKTGARRTDLVLVTSANDNEQRENIKLDILVGLIEMGIIVESEVRVPPNSNMFVKLHAPDDVLDKYAGALGKRKYFRTAHESLMSEKKSFLGSRFKLEHESEWLKSVRSRYTAPLRYSNQERSYIVYMMLRHQCNVLGYKLDRLLLSRIFYDMFALHDGPYYCPEQDNFKIYNCRQVLFLNWAGSHNMFKYQPMHMVNEYFGSKIACLIDCSQLAFYFMFYGFYNKALIFASFWGIFMTVMYLIKDIEFFRGIREYGCGANFRHRRWLAQNATWSTHRHTLLDEEHSQGNFLCEGEQLPTVCHMVILEDLCLGMHVRRITESPYMILYSAGIAFWALLFLTFWKRTERYWMWMWEENLFPKHQLFRTVSEQQFATNLNRKEKKRTGKKKIINGCIALWAIIILFLILFIGIFYAHVEWLKPLTVEMKELDDETSKSLGQVLVVPEVDELLDIILLILLAIVILILLFILEKVFHSAAYISTTQFERYLTYERFEKSLVSKYFFYSFVYTSSLVIYFTWLKGTFHNGILDVWYATFNVTTPWATYVIATPNISKYVTHVIRRAVTMNCGQFSCFNEGVIVFVITLLFRDVTVRIIEIIKRNKTNKNVETENTMTTCEREYHLKPVTERQVVDDFNTLFIQLALVTLFAPMFPLAPLLALIVNMFDMRNKASMYTMHSRRALLFQSAGIGYWNHILKLICYAAPLFHGFCIARTEIFKMYIYYKYQVEFWTVHSYIWKGFTTTTLAINIRKRLAMMHHSGFYEANKYRVYSEHNETYVFRKTEFHPDLGTYHHFSADVARVDGYYDQTNDRIEDDWPNQWNFIGENYSFNTPHPAHYHIKLLRVAFILSYVLVFAALSVLVWQLVRGCPGRVARRLQRERVLRRLHQHRLTHLRQRAPDASD